MQRPCSALSTHHDRGQRAISEWTVWVLPPGTHTNLNLSPVFLSTNPSSCANPSLFAAQAVETGICQFPLKLLKVFFSIGQEVDVLPALSGPREMLA